MSPSIKRYGPYLGAAAALIAGVYFIAGDRLTGQAGLHDPNIEHLGTVKPELLEKLDEIIAKPVLPRVQSGQRPEATAITAITADVEKLGHEALASVVMHFRNNGCIQPGSVAEVEIIKRLVDDDKITSLQRRVIAHILIDAAGYAARDIETTADQPLSVYPEVQQVTAQLHDGNLTKIPEIQVKPDDPVIAWECSMEALKITATMLKTGVIDATALHRKSLEEARALPKDHPAVPAFIHVATLAANASKQAPAVFAEMYTDQNLSEAARAVACQGALDAGVPVGEITKTLADDRPIAIQACLVRAGDESTIQAALDSDDLELRVAAINRVALAQNEPKIKHALEAADQPGVSPRVRFAWLASVGRAVATADDPERLLKPIEQLAEANPDSLLPKDLAMVLHSNNANKPEIQAVAEDEEEPPLVSSLVAVATGEGTIVVPSSIAFEVTAQAARDDELQVKEQPLWHEPHCDAVIEPGPLQATLDSALVKLKAMKGSVVCISEGKYTGPLVIEHAGLRLYAIGDVVLEKSVIVKAPVTIVGATMHGPLVLSATAQGSIIVANALEEGGLSETSQVAITYNDLPEGKFFKLPGGNLIAEADEPPAAWWTYEPAAERTIAYSLVPNWPPVL